MTMCATLLIALLSTTAQLPGADAYLSGAHAERSRNWNSAQSAYATAAQVEGPLTAYALARQAVCLGKSGNAEGGEAMLRQVLNAYPDGPWVKMIQSDLADLLKGQRRNLEAAPLYAEMLDMTPQPTWFETRKWRAAENMTATSMLSEAGYTLFEEIMETGRWRSTRRDAAYRLTQSNTAEHVLPALHVLLDSGVPERVEEVLPKLLTPGVLNNPRLRAQWQVAQGRLLLLNGAVEQGQLLLGAVASLYPDSPAGHQAIEYLVRSHVAQNEDAIATSYLLYLIKVAPDSPFAGNALFWWGELLAANGAEADAVSKFASLAELQPEHPMADTALERAAAIQRKSGQNRAALLLYEWLASRYPGSSYRPEGLYWTGRLWEAAGDRRRAGLAYQRAANGPMGTFYVHRAVEKLHDMRLAPEKTGATLSILGTNAGYVRPRGAAMPSEEPFPAEWSSQPWFQRLYFFGAHGLEEGEWEAQYVLRELQKDPQPALKLRVVADAGVAESAMQIAARSEWLKGASVEDDFQRIHFPRAYWPYAVEMGRATGLDPYLVLAVAKQESMFRARSTSSAGARGVMQLMPPTAKWMNEVESAITNEDVADLENPRSSIKLGAYYLRRMLSRSDGNLIFALCSYNAGPGNLDKWRARYSAADLDAFIENIPFDETKHYVKKVLGNYAAYRSLYPAAAP